MKNPPGRRRDYIGPVTDTRIWNQFELRSSDVVLSTPPKCGTTWSQAILMMLIHGEADSDRMVWRDSYWLDCGFRDQQELKSKLDAQTHRRCIKSHTPFDGIPFDPDVTYFSVFRHPVDVHFSMESHVKNMKNDILDFLFPPEPGAAFNRFLEAPANDSGTDDLTLSSILRHYRSFAKWEHLPNVHLFHYAGLSRDLPGNIRNYATAIGHNPDDDLVAAIAQAASFGAMKETTRNAKPNPSHGVFHVEHKFFDSATSSKWEGRLSQPQLEAYRQRFSEIAEPAEIRWLEAGAVARG